MSMQTLPREVHCLNQVMCPVHDWGPTLEGIIINGGYLTFRGKLKDKKHIITINK